MKRIDIPKGSRQLVRKILNDIVNTRNGTALDNSWGGSKPRIVDLTPL